jgi:hypothetical protein
VAADDDDALDDDDDELGDEAGAASEPDPLDSGAVTPSARSDRKPQR